MKKPKIYKADKEMQENYSNLEADVLVRAYKRDKGELAYVFADGKLLQLEAY